MSLRRGVQSLGLQCIVKKYSFSCNLYVAILEMLTIFNCLVSFLVMSVMAKEGNVDGAV